MKLFYQSQQGFLFEYRIDRLDYPPHIHNAVELVFLLEGSSSAYCAGERVALTAGDIFVAFPNQIHSYENSRNIRGFVLILPIKPCLAPYAAAIGKQKPENCCLRRGQWEHTGLLQIIELAHRDSATASPAVMQAYTQVIFGKLLPLLKLRSAEGGADEAVRTLLEYLEGHYREPLTRAQIARAVGYHESYVSHIFSGTLNTTLPEYINALRVYDASELLLETDLPVTRIAAELGFGSVRNFNRVFQKETGLAPRDYRTRGGDR